MDGKGKMIRQKSCGGRERPHGWRRIMPVVFLILTCALWGLSFPVIKALIFAGRGRFVLLEALAIRTANLQNTVRHS